MNRKSDNLKRENARKRTWRNRRNYQKHMSEAIRHQRAAFRSLNLWEDALKEVKEYDTSNA